MKRIEILQKRYKKCILKSELLLAQTNLLHLTHRCLIVMVAAACGIEIYCFRRISVDNSVYMPVFRDYRFGGAEVAGACTRYQLVDSKGDGDGDICCYEVLSGIMLTYDRLNMESCFQQVTPEEGYLQISYCSEGGFEFTLQSGQVRFLGAGDLCASDPWSRGFIDSRVPQRHYRGISIILRLADAEESLHRYFPEMPVDIRRLQKRLFSQELACFVRTNRAIGEIFHSLYHVDERMRGPFIMLKIAEILLLLDVFLEDSKVRSPCFSQNVVSCTKAVYAYLTERHYPKTTVAQLSGKFHIAQSALQQCFKAVYGQPIASFLRSRRIHQSALLLQKHAELSVGEVAQRAGYENQSKFSAAFKAVMGQTPLMYRHQSAYLNGELEQN